MKTFIIILISILLTYVDCKSQQTSAFDNDNFTLTVEFFPSFIPPSRLIIQKKKEKNRLVISNLYSKKRYNLLNDKKLTIEPFDSCLIKNNLSKRFYGDTIFRKKLEEASVAKDVFKQFIDSLTNINFSIHKSLYKEGIVDGITVYIRFRTDTSDHIFSLRCPDREDKEFIIIKSIFTLFEQSCKSASALNYLEHLKGYFDFGLQVKQISQNPLEYRFYGALTSGEQNEFYQLMDSLPLDKPVIFDFSNFKSMGTMFYTDFEEFIDKNPHVFWIAGKYSLRQITAIGVAKNRIVTTRKELLSALKKIH
ncbi:MAG: hypothetical protein ACOVOW_18220 [Spirosomataceae bacterium]